MPATTIEEWGALDDRTLREVAFRCTEGFIDYEDDKRRLCSELSSPRSLVRLLQLQTEFGDLRIPLLTPQESLMTWLSEYSLQSVDQADTLYLDPKSFSDLAVKLFLWGRDNRYHLQKKARSRIGTLTSYPRVSDSLRPPKHLSEKDVKKIQRLHWGSQKRAATKWQAEHPDDRFAGRRTRNMSVESLVYKLEFIFKPDPDDAQHVFEAYPVAAPDYVPAAAFTSASASTAAAPTTMDLGFPDFDPVRPS